MMKGTGTLSFILYCYPVLSWCSLEVICLKMYRMTEIFIGCWGHKEKKLPGLGGKKVMAECGGQITFPLFSLFKGVGVHGNFRHQLRRQTLVPCSGRARGDAKLFCREPHCGMLVAPSPSEPFASQPGMAPKGRCDYVAWWGFLQNVVLCTPSSYATGPMKLNI